MALDSLARSLEDLYRESGAWERARVMDVLRLPTRWGAASIALRDHEGRMICAVGPGVVPARGEGHGARGRMRREARDADRSGDVMGDVMEDLAQACCHPSAGLSLLDEASGSKGRRVIRLTSEGRVIGVLDADARVPRGRFEWAFVSHLAFYTLAGILVMILVACGLGSIVAGRLSRPVARAVERTKRICNLPDRRLTGDPDIGEALVYRLSQRSGIPSLAQVGSPDVGILQQVARRPLLQKASRLEDVGPV